MRGDDVVEKEIGGWPPLHQRIRVRFGFDASVILEVGLGSDHYYVIGVHGVGVLEGK